MSGGARSCRAFIGKMKHCITLYIHMIEHYTQINTLNTQV